MNDLSTQARIRQEYGRIKCDLISVIHRIGFMGFEPAMAKKPMPDNNMSSSRRKVTKITEHCTKGRSRIDANRRGPSPMAHFCEREKKKRTYSALR